MILAIDLDGTIADEKRTFERALARPLPGALDCLRKLKEEGHRIIIYTARSWSEYELTKNWLESFDIAHDELIMGKPVVDMFIDDRAVRFTSWQDITSLLNEGANRAKRNPYAFATNHAEQFRKWVLTHPLAGKKFVEISSGDYNDYPGTLLRGDAFDIATAAQQISADYQSLTLEELDGHKFEAGTTLLAIHAAQFSKDIVNFAKLVERSLAPGDTVFLVTPWLLPRSKRGRDNWRLSSDTLRYLFNEKCNFEILHLKHVGFDYEEENAVAIECVLRRLNG